MTDLSNVVTNSITVNRATVNDEMRNSKGHFVKGNSEGYTSSRRETIKGKLTIMINEEDLAALKNIPDWRERTREHIKLIIKDHGH
ncbi:MAG: hypothetical protein AAFS12_07560 [Cyanobacteria bacterium J06632_19]